MNILNLSESVKHAVHVAESLAKERHHASYGPPHLLAGLMHKETGLRPMLTALDKDPGYLQEWAEIRMDEFPNAKQLHPDVKGTPEVALVFEEADDVRLKMGLDLITPVCVLTALSKPNIGFPAEQMKSFPVKERDLLEVYLNDTVIQPSVQEEGIPGEQKSGALAKYCIDRTAPANQGKIDPIIGRDMELRMVMEVLCRRSKPNVIITGDAGVGKTALIDGLAQQIVKGEVPGALKDARILELDTGALIAGASYKGEIEDRLKKIIGALKQSGKVILFIDEIHALLDLKGSIGSGAGNLLKPELARGEITVIGATTIEEYRKIIEPEKAFSRRFEVVQVAEPDIDTAVKMLQCQLERYEAHHELKVQPGTVEECVRLAKRYMKDRRLPDAAFDLLDRTMAAIRMMNDTSVRELQELEEELNISSTDTLISLRRKLSPVLLGRLDAEPPEDEESLYSYLKSTLDKLRELAKEKITETGKQDVAAVIAFKTGIPIGKIQTQEREKLMNMEAQLKQRVVGQDHALKALSAAILESRSGLGKKGQPIGSFFLLGPTGTGKTELAKSIAEFLFNDEKAMIRFDMSEFKEEHSAALLYGAPPGYVGYEEGGLLVNKIRQQPYTVLLFDEIEKAHPSVFDIFLQIMDEGLIHDRLGKEGDFSNALILFTSNIGSEWISAQFNNAKMPQPNQLMELMTQHFRPEFLARLSEIVPFSPITEENVIKIFDIQLKSLLEALHKQHITLEISDDARKTLALSGFTPRYGARQITGVIRNQLRRPISRQIISGEVSSGKKITLLLKDGTEELVWKITEA
ncbi:ATP-dependent Clp protease ATP-binding subunit ClpA [Chitinophaga dinghuensis]|uniref:ATP-dependent Clp protease ATP-binding subunit ClpA n=1 Tax=Chitinophaga dinghuensis TaxID=1539050 RepID=A0A327WEV5_9BACT|nr:ATP-dependent Clp protease ATP-binding subunit [Chitinophaga dinghuensis]RAJ88091.1 ATP-dependent Clp protease ATP-binding subunit ClpA [Chitinophaga dinghuensis]